MWEWCSGRRWWIAAMVVGLVLRVIFCLHHPRFDGDTLVYGDLAKNMLQHHVYGLTENVVRPTLIRLPGYPLFLAACFVVFGVGNYAAAIWVQAVVGLAACWMLGRLGERVWGERVGLWVLWLACVCPFTANYDAAALTETWAIFCVVAALFGLERWVATRGLRWAMVIGLACSFAVLLRPDRGLLAAAVVGVLLWRREWRAVVVVCLLVAAPLGVWAGRNWRVFHVVQPLAPKNANDPGEFVSHGFDRWYRTWGLEYLSTTNTYWIYDGGTISMADLPARAVDSEAQRVETARAYEAYNAVASGTPAVDAMFGKIAAERVAAHPVRSCVLMPLGRLADMWLRPRTEFFKLPLDWWRFGGHPGKSVVCLLYAGLDWVLLGLALVGLRRVRWSPVVMAGVGFVVLRSVLLLTIDNAEQRYTLECLPVVFLLAGAALAIERKKTHAGDTA